MIAAKSLATLVVASVLLTCVAGAGIGWDFVQQNATIQQTSSGGSLLVPFSANATNTTVMWAHCFGEIDVYIGLGFAPNTSFYNVLIKWGSGSDSYFGYGPLANITAYFLFVCKGSYSPVCATLDILYYLAPTVPTDFIPVTQPTTATYGVNPPHGTTTLYKTGNAADSYTWYYTLGNPPPGYYPSTPCGFLAYTQALVGSGYGYVSSDTPLNQTVTVGNWSSSQALTVGVLVTRAGGYPNVTNTYALNAGINLIPSLVTMVAVFVAAIM